MDKSLRGFLKLSFAVIFVFFLAVVFLAFFYQYSTLSLYNSILLFLTIVTILIMILIIFSVLAIFIAYKTGKADRLLMWPVRFGLKVLIPAFIGISGMRKSNSDNVRQLYIDLNNMLVQKSVYRKYLPEDVLVILPHCLQDSKCRHKVAGAISNCRRCGRCCIGEIACVIDEMSVSAEIVTGGTAARNIVFEKKPKIILSVACERDLASGISDIGEIPVLGIVNERPNGPCCNTNVDAKLIRERLKGMLDELE